MCKAQTQNHKKFGKKVVAKRKTDIKNITESLKKIADEEVTRVQSLWKDHVDFFNEDGSVEDTGSLIPITTFFEQTSSEE